MKIPSTVLIAGIAVLLMSGPSAAADKDILQLQNDVVKLQQTVQALQKSVDEKNTAMMLRMDKTSDQMNNINMSVQKIAELVGSIRTDNATAAASSAKSATETRDTLVPLIGQLQKSVGDLNEGLTGMRTQMKSISDQMISKSTTEPLPTCKDFKQAADRNFNSNYLEDAAAGYRDFLSMCATDPKASEVQFSIAETYFNLKKFDQALTEYDIFLQRNPGHDKTASALLRKGLAHAELKQIPEARTALSRVTTQFKGTPEAIKATDKLKELGPAPAAGRGSRGNQ